MRNLSLVEKNGKGVDTEPERREHRTLGPG